MNLNISLPGDHPNGSSRNDRSTSSIILGTGKLTADRFGFSAFPITLIAMITGAMILQFVVLKRLAGIREFDKQKAMEAVVRVGVG